MPTKFGTDVPSEVVAGVFAVTVFVAVAVTVTVGAGFALATFAAGLSVTVAVVVTVGAGADFESATVVALSPLPAVPIMTPMKNRTAAPGMTNRFLVQAGRRP
ncbi:hypothetical protein [Streptomyces sp. DW26H14]|uniref:hypothetical protein n=1 Tax=Streptomyces sp. DW26H14 TaxID=3435395 RepID=UPI00403DCEBD